MGTQTKQMFKLMDNNLMPQMFVYLDQQVPKSHDLAPIGTASANSMESDLGCTLVIYFDNVMLTIAPDKNWRQLGIYPPLFGFIGYFKF